MIQISDIGWGSYMGFEGPVFHGRTKVQAPSAVASEDERVVYILTQTEGGAYSAVNMYDRCVVSAGLFQFCESHFLTSKLIGAMLSEHPHLGVHLAPALDASNAVFRKNAAGKWRFFFKTGEEVDTVVEQRRLFLLNSDGLRGSWDDESKEHAKLWAASFANLLEQPEAFQTQVVFSANHLKSFAMKDSYEVLFNDGLPSTGWTGALRAAFLSYAGNLPAVANKHLGIALKTAPGQKWSKDWCIHILRELTFGPQIAIYPGRYDKIRPVVERLYGVDLPDFAKELKAWQAVLEAECPARPADPNMADVSVIQSVLDGLGYDLGPRGIDGRLGGKTRDAIITFQRLSGLTPDAIVGPKTRAKLIEAWRRLNP